MTPCYLWICCTGMGLSRDAYVSLRVQALSRARDSVIPVIGVFYDYYEGRSPSNTLLCISDPSSAM